MLVDPFIVFSGGILLRQERFAFFRIPARRASEGEFATDPSLARRAGMRFFRAGGNRGGRAAAEELTGVVPAGSVTRERSRGLVRLLRIATNQALDGLAPWLCTRDRS